MLTTPNKSDLQSLLDINDPENRMATVTAMILKELAQLKE